MSKNNIISEGLHHAFYPDDQAIVYEKGMYVNERENKEYTFYVDTAFRNLKNNPNPFQFQIEFTPLAGNQDISFPLKVDEANYIFIRQVLLPVRLLNESMINQRFFVLRIKELTLPYQYYCSNNINDKTDIILFNSGIQGYNLVLEGKTVTSFRDDLKPKLTRLTFQFLMYDSCAINVANNLQGSSDEDSLLIYPTAENNVEDIYSEMPQVDPSQPFNNVFIEMKIGVNDMQILSKN